MGGEKIYVILPKPVRAPLTDAEYEALMLDAVAKDAAKEAARLSSRKT